MMVCVKCRLGIANSVDPDQIASTGVDSLCSVWSNLSVQIHIDMVVLHCSRTLGNEMCFGSYGFYESILFTIKELLENEYLMIISL